MLKGKNIVFELRYAEGKPDRLPALADELVRLKVDVIIADCPNDGLSAKNATKTIPIVFTDSPSGSDCGWTGRLAWRGPGVISRDSPPCPCFSRQTT